MINVFIIFYLRNFSYILYSLCFFHVSLSVFECSLCFLHSHNALCDTSLYVCLHFG